MNNTESNLVEKTFSLIRPNADLAATLFYTRLFEINPQLRPLFRGDLKEQGRKLMATIGTAVAASRNPEPLKIVLESLAVRHIQYGVATKDFDDVGAALLWTLEKGLGDNFTDEVRHAWVTLYGEIVAVMLPKFSTHSQ